MANRIDWQTIRSAYADEDCILILNARVAGILTSLWHILEYEATFRLNDYDYADWDYLQRILADAAGEVGNPMKLADLVTYIDGIETLLTSIRDYQANQCCNIYERNDFSGGAQYTDAVTDGSGDVPQNIIDAGYASGTTDWAGYDDYKCMVSTLVIEDIVLKLEQIGSLFDIGAGVAVTVGAVALIIGAVLAVPVTTLVTVAAFIGSFVTATQVWEGLLTLGGSGVGDFATDIDGAKSELACLVYTGSNTQDSIDQLSAGLVELLGSTGGQLVMGMGVEDSIRAMLGGRYDQTDVAARLAELGYTTSGYDCSSCVEPLGPDEFDASWSFEDQSLDGWGL